MVAMATFSSKGEFQIRPRMDFHNILYVEYLRYNDCKNEIISFLEGCKATGGHLDVHPICTNIWPFKYQSQIINIIDCYILWMEYERRLPRVYLTTINVYEYTYIIFSDPSKFDLSPYWALKLVSIGDSVLIFTMFQFLSTQIFFRKVGQIHPLYACKFS